MRYEEGKRDETLGLALVIDSSRLAHHRTEHFTLTL